MKDIWCLELLIFPSSRYNNSFDFRIRPRSCSEHKRAQKRINSKPEVVGSIPTEVIRILFFTSCGSLIPFTRANAQWVFHGVH